MNNTNWMLHHFKNLDMHDGYGNVPWWHSDLLHRLHLDDEDEAIETLFSVVKYGGLSPLCLLLRGDCVGRNHDAALQFSSASIYPTNNGGQSKDSTNHCFAIALITSELITAGARAELNPVLGIACDPETSFDADEWDSESFFSKIETEITSIANNRFRPPPAADTYRCPKLYWQITERETEHPIKLYNRYWRDRGAINLPAFRLFGGIEDNCYLTKAYIVVPSRYQSEIFQNLATGLYYRSLNYFDTPFSRERLLDTNIIITDEIAAATNEPLTIEEIEQKYSAAIVKAVDTMTVFDDDIYEKVAAAVTDAVKDGTNAMNAYIATHGEHPWEPCGFAHAETSEVTHPIVQHMIQSGLAVTWDEDAIVRVRGLPLTQSKYQLEAAYIAVCKTLTLRLGVCFEMFSYDD
jgi:hypothetical protein